jgi:predicted RNA-binding Zn ribbon-like protein
MRQDAQSKAVDDGADCDRFSWIDLQADRDELHPHSWGQVPAAVVSLRGALDGLYQGAMGGPTLETADAEEAALLRRLAGLGYIEL